MLNKILNEKIFKILDQKVGFNCINEIRIRDEKPIVVISNGQVYFLEDKGLTLTKKDAIWGTKFLIEDIIFKASEYSIYSVNEELKQGFIVLDGGERIGVCGSVVLENNNIKTITNFSSVNIRIPHEIKNCCLKVFDKLITTNNIFNILIISPPGQGKTTFLRDFVFQLSEKNFLYNVLIIDERGEIAGKNNKLDIGCFCDILSFTNKQNGFMQGIRAMNPNLIITDELGDEQDFDAIKYASNCGVKIVATIHAENINQLKNKIFFEKIKNIFDRYVVLKNNTKPGVIEGVYDNEFAKIF
ncbi:MAG: stage III sporulation protein AA [Clostridia bacterium]|nr:stage III sporulation protein AA [Clostridia bacterium]